MFLHIAQIICEIILEILTCLQGIDVSDLRLIEKLRLISVVNPRRRAPIHWIYHLNILVHPLSIAQATHVIFYQEFLLNA